MRICADNTAAVIIDMQERLLPSICEGEALLDRCSMLIQGLNILEIPILIPRQYPKGLGDTVAAVKEAVGEHTPIDKVEFSVCDNEQLMQAIRSLGKKNIIVCGVEAHVCVLQTVIDLVAADFHPVLVCDCIGSRNKYDKKIGIKRAVQEGAVTTTAESILFEILRKAGGEKFKAISKLVK